MWRWWGNAQAPWPFMIHFAAGYLFDLTCDQGLTLGDAWGLTISRNAPQPQQNE